ALDERHEFLGAEFMRALRREEIGRVHADKHVARLQRSGDLCIPVLSGLDAFLVAESDRSVSGSLDPRDLALQVFEESLKIEIILPVGARVRKEEQVGDIHGLPPKLGATDGLMLPKRAPWSSAPFGLRIDRRCGGDVNLRSE